MPLDSNNSARATAPTSASAPATPLSESDFLTRQAADAKAAIAATFDQMKHDLATGADPRAWVQVAPWTTLAGAAIAGFVAASLAVPSKEQQAIKRLRKLEEALNPRPHNDARNGDDRRHDERPASFMSGFAGSMLKALQPVLMSAISAAVGAKVADNDQSAAPADANGAAPASTPPPAASDASAI